MTSHQVITFVLLLFISTSLFSQDGNYDSGDNSEASLFLTPLNWNVYVVAGASHHFPSGSGISNFESQFSDFSSDGPELIRQSSSVEGYFSPAIGVRFGVFQKSDIEAGFGLHYTRRGTTLKGRTQISDPVFQVDDYFQFQAEIRSSALEIPLWVLYQWKPKLYVGGGITAGLPLKGTSKVTTNTSYDVYLNGELDEEFSLLSTNETESLEDDTKSVYLGYFVEARYSLPYGVMAGVRLQYLGSYIKYADGNIGGFNTELTLAYKIR